MENSNDIATYCSAFNCNNCKGQNKWQYIFEIISTMVLQFIIDGF
jgi:hypothetical protein